jgi:hypothetical protein
MWNYEHHPALAAYVDQQLVATYPEHFAGVQCGNETQAAKDGSISGQIGIS